MTRFQRSSGSVAALFFQNRRSRSFGRKSRRRNSLSQRLRSALLQPLEERVMLDIGGPNTLPPTIVVGRTLSAYDVPDVQNNQETLTFSVYNQAADPITGVLLTDTLANGVTFDSASQLPDENGQQLAWSLGTVQPYDRASVTLTVTLGAGLLTPTPTVPVQLDTGASAYGTLDAGMVNWTTAPATLRATAIAANLLVSTPDANTTDPYVQEKAAELNYDPNQIFNFLQTQIGYNSYVGSLRGARGTLWSSAGNSLDDASLGVALMRASGIPAQYEQGTLSTAQAQQLILSMFPASYQTVGYVSSGSLTADPANDPQLLSETENHYWFQFDSGNGMTDADPEFAANKIGQTATTATGGFGEVADSLRQKTEITLTAEIYDQGAAAFGLSDGLSQSTVLDQTFNDVDLVGRPLSLGFNVSSSAVGFTIGAQTNTYSPYLAWGDNAYDSTHDQIITGRSFQDVLTNFPFSSQVVTGVFLNVVTSGPQGPSQTYSRSLVDRIGYAARQGLAPVQVSIPSGGAPALSNNDVYTLQISAAGAPPASSALNQELERDATELPIATTSSAPTAQPLARDFGIDLTRVLANNYLNLSQLHTGMIAREADVVAYFDQPRIVMASETLQSAAGTGGGFTSAIDILSDAMRIEAPPGQSVTAPLVFDATRGIFDNLSERDTVAALAPSAQAAQVDNTFDVLTAAAAQGIGLVTITSDNLAAVSSLDLPADVVARITTDAEQGYYIIVPERMVAVGGTPTIAWAEINLATGEYIGVDANGGHEGSFEFIALAGETFEQELTALKALSPVAGFDAGALIGVSYQLQALIGNEEEAAKELPEEKEQAKKLFEQGLGMLEKLATGLGKVASALGAAKSDGGVDKTVSKASKQAEKGFELALEATVQNLTGNDPPITALQFDPSPLAALPANQAQGSFNVATTSAAGAVQGNVQVPRIVVSHQITATWSSSATSAMQATELSTASGTIVSSTGQTLGTGAVALAATNAVAVAVSGSNQYQINGTGDLSFYGPAETTLGVSGDWISYSAAITGSVSLTVTTDALTLNGATLPAGTYTITTSSASLIGSGNTTSPDFAGSASITSTGGTVQLAAGSGNLTVGGAAVGAAEEVTLAFFNGTLTVSSNGNGTDAVTLSGNATNVLTMAPSPTTLTTDQNTAASFNANVRTSFADAYNLTATGPAGWTVTIDNAGNVTVIPAPGTQGGTYPIQVVAKSTTNPDLVSQAIVEVTVTPTSPGVTLAVTPDSQFTVPFNGAQLPLAFRATLQNTGPGADTYNLTFSNVPSGFTILNSGTSLTVPAGKTGVVGLYLQPTGAQLPPPGTNLSFTATATSATNPAITQTVNVSLTMPTIDAVTLASNPTSVTSTPGSSTTATITITNVGNVPANVPLSAMTDSGLTASGLPNTPITVGIGQSTTETVTLTPDANAALNSTLTATINAGSAATVQIPLAVRSAQTVAISQASVDAGSAGDSQLSGTLSELSDTISQLQAAPTDSNLLSRTQLLLNNLQSELSADPVLASTTSQLTQIQTDAKNGDVSAMLSAVPTFFTNVDKLLAVEAAEQFTVNISPGEIDLPALANQQKSITVTVTDTGPDAVTLNLSTASLPSGVSASLGQTQLTLEPGASQNVTLTLTSNLVSTHIFTLDVKATDSTDSTLVTVARDGMAIVAVRAAAADVLGVTVNPISVTSAGTPIAVSASIFDTANASRDVLAHITVLDSNNNVVASPPDVPITLTPTASAVSFDLGNLDTTGLANGVYTLEVSLRATDGSALPGRSSEAPFLVGIPITASASASPSTLPPGTSSVTTTITASNTDPEGSGDPGGAPVQGSGTTSPTSTNTQSPTTDPHSPTTDSLSLDSSPQSLVPSLSTNPQSPTPSTQTLTSDPPPPPPSPPPFNPPTGDAVNWIGTTSGNWDVAANWLDTTTNSKHVPDATDNVTIDASGLTITVEAGNQAAQSLLVKSGSTLKVAGGNLVVSAGSEIDGTLQLASSTLTLAGGTTINGNLQWSGGTLNLDGGNLFNLGTIGLSNNLGMVSNNNAGTNNLKGTFFNEGTVVEQSGGLWLYDSVEVDNTSLGTWQFTGDVGINYGTFSPSIVNSGLIQKTGGTGNSDINVAMANIGGTLEADSGTLRATVSNDSFTDGVFNAQSGNTVWLNANTSGMTFSGTFTGTGAGTVLLEGGSIDLAGDTTFNFPMGMFQWYNATVNLGGHTLTNAGSMLLGLATQASTETVSATDASNNPLGGTFENGGTLTVQGAATVYLDDNVVLDNPVGGSLQFAGNATGAPGLFVGNNTPSFTNEGTIEKASGTGTSQIAVPFIYTGGPIKVDSGSLMLDPPTAAISGTNFTVAAGATLDLTGNSTGNVFTGTFTGSGSGTVLLAGGWLNVGNAGASFDLPSGMFRWTGGNINLDGHTFTNTGSITLANANNVTIISNANFAGGPQNGNNQGGTFNNAGAIVEQAAGSLGLYDSVAFDNQASGTYTLASDAGIYYGDFSIFLTNAGLIDKSAGSGTSVIGVALNNSGKLDVDSGTLSLQGNGGTSTGGVFTVATGATLILAGNGTIGNLYSGTYTGSGGGTVAMGNGSIVIGAGGATFNFPTGMFQWTAGGINLDGNTLTNAGSMTVANSGNVSLYGNGNFPGGSQKGADQGGTLDNQGTLTDQGPAAIYLYDGVLLKNEPGATINLSGGASLTYQNYSAAVSNLGTIQVNGSTATIATPLANSGTIIASGGGMLSFNQTSSLNNSGTLEANGSTITFSGSITQDANGILSGGTWIATAGGTITLPANSNITVSDARLVVSGAGSVIGGIGLLVRNDGALTVTSGANFTTASNFTNNGSLTLRGGSSAGALRPAESTALGFNGSTDFVQVGNLGARPTQGTIAFWIKPAAVSSYQNVLTTGPTDSNGVDGNQAIRFEEVGQSLYADFGSDTAADNGSSGFSGFLLTNSLTPGAWVNVAVTWDSSTNTVTGYLNGEQVFSSTNSNWPSNFGNVTFGLGYASNPAYNRYYNGLLSDVRFYSVERSQSDIQSDMSQLLTGNETGLIGYWPLNDGSGATAKDLTANAHNGTLGGGTAADEPVWVPIAPAATFVVPGNFTQTSNGTLDFQLGGTPTSGQFGQLVATGTAAFAGMLRSEFTNGYTPAAGDNFTVATYANTAGSFNALDLAETPTVAYSANVGTSALVLTSQAATLSATQTTVTSSAPNGANYGQLVEYTATVTASSGTPTGSVQFQIDGLNYGAPIVLSAGQATLTVSLPVGSHSIVAFYISGNSQFSNSDDSANPLIQVINPASLTPGSIELYYTTFGGPSSIDKVAVSLGQGTLTLGTPTPIVQNLPADGLIFLPNGDLLTANGAASEVNPNTGAVTTETQVAGEHLALDPSGKYVWTSPQPGPLYKLPISPLAPATQETLNGDDTSVTQLAFDNAGQVFYTASGGGGNGSFGLIDLTTFTTKRIYSDLPAAHGISFDPFTGDLFLVGASSVVQINPNTLKIVSELNFPGGFTFDQGANDGKGHLFAADNNGHLLVVDYSATGLVGDPRNFVATPFLATDLDDVAPLSGLGGAGIPVTINHQLPATGYNVNPTSITPNPSSFSSSGVIWNTTFTPGVPETDPFQLAGQVTNMAPGEVRQISTGTTVTATITAADGTQIPVSIQLPPVTVAAQHIIELTPPTNTVDQGATATYTVELSNPLPTDETYTLTVGGLLSGENATLATSVAVPAGQTVDVPLTISVPLGALQGTQAFLVSAQTLEGAFDSVEGQLTVNATVAVPSLAVNLTLTPTASVAGQSNPALYTITVTNTGDTTDTYSLSGSFPAGFIGTFSQTTITVPPGISNFRDIQLSLTPPVGATAQNYPFTVTATSSTDGTVSSKASGTATVLPQGVQVSLTPSSAVPGSTYQLKVTNTGQTTDTFNLSLGSPGSLVSTLGTNQVTLQPGASQTVPVTTKAVTFADPGALSLTGVATSATNSAVQSQSTADLAIAPMQSMTAAFDPAQQTLVVPGATSFLLDINNTGNTEDSYSATIVSTSGPITANLVGLDGQPAQSVPLFVVPGLATGAILLQVNATGTGQDTVTVLVQSLTNSDIKAAPTATVTVPVATTPPPTLTLTNNTGLVVAEGSAATMTDAMLQTTDSDTSVTAANVDYTLTSVPTQGTLSLNGQALPAGGTFTQDDVNNGRVTYRASEEGADSFGFNVVASGATGISGTFLISTSDPAVIATGGLTLSASEGSSSSVQAVATFTDPGGFEPQASYTADIDWGDGTSSAGTIELPTSGTITSSATVTGQHAYAEQGTYPIHVTLHHEGAPDATAVSTAVVSDPAVAASGGFTYSAILGSAPSAQTVAVFTDPGGAEAVSDYAATIDWGDGSPATTGAISVDPATHIFTVSGAHPYAQDNTYTIKVTLTHESAPAVTVNSTAQIAKATTLGGPGIAATPLAISGYELKALTAVAVATYTDGNNSLPAADFSAAIDWGDGTTSAGSISLSAGTYTVTGSHQYSDEGHFTTSVEIAQTAGPMSGGATTATVGATATIHEQLLAEGTVGTPNQNYIQEIYRDVFGRLAEPQGRDYWVAQLAQGESRQQVAYQMVQIASFQEFQHDTVAALYEQYLGRAPEETGRAYWTAYLYNGGTIESMSQALVSSSEYYQSRGDGTVDGFLKALFQDALGRPIDPDAFSFFEKQMAQGATAAQVAATVFASDEYHRVRVDALFEQFMDRAAAQNELAQYATELDNGASDETVISQLLATDEYFAKSQV